MKPKIVAPEVKEGTILNNSVGSGCDSFYQVIERTGNIVRVQHIESKHINVNVACQTCDVVPNKGKFCSGGQRDFMNLRLKTDERGQLQIGPVKRLIWWSVWDGKPKDQWSA